MQGWKQKAIPLPRKYSRGACPPNKKSYPRIQKIERADQEILSRLLHAFLSNLFLYLLTMQTAAAK